MSYNDNDRQAFCDGYAECAVWTGLDWDDQDETGNPAPLDDKYSVDDIAPEALASMRADCDAFITANAGDLDRVGDMPMSAQQKTAAGDLTPAKAGHDFWLTRNRHGAGFWDEYFGDDAELLAAFKRLTDAAHVYGESDLYVGDDGKLYI